MRNSAAITREREWQDFCWRTGSSACLIAEWRKTPRSNRTNECVCEEHTNSTGHEWFGNWLSCRHQSAHRHLPKNAACALQAALPPEERPPPEDLPLAEPLSLLRTLPVGFFCMFRVPAVRRERVEALRELLVPLPRGRPLVRALPDLRPRLELERVRLD